MLLALLVSAALAHDPDACAQVQAVRAQAIAAQLDTATLDILAGRLCGAGARPPGGPLCQQAEQIASVARIGGSSGSALAEVERLRDLACDGLLEGSVSWRNGVAARRIDGSWSYPNAVLARGADGSLHYPNAVLARGADGTWHYPNAVLARGADGRWYRPDAVQVGGMGELVSWACDRKPDRCEQAREAIRGQNAENAHLALVALAWEAR